MSEYQLKVIGACCRGVNRFPKRIYYTCNPGGQGHGYIKRIFIDRRYEETRIRMITASHRHWFMTTWR